MEHYSPFWYQSMKPIHILGISCSTRMLGLAVFYSNLLIDYRIILNKNNWSQHKKNQFIAIVQHFCTSHSITDIALAIPADGYLTDECAELLDGIQRFANKNSITVTDYTLVDVYKTFGNRTRPTRATLIRRMAMFYEELEQYELKELQNKHKYYIKLFEAVACASIHVLAIQEKQG